MATDPTPSDRPGAVFRVVYDAQNRATTWWDAPGVSVWTVDAADGQGDSPVDPTPDGPPDEPHVVG